MSVHPIISTGIGRCSVASSDVTVVRILLALIVLSGSPAAGRPNVVFILADDLGWADTTLHGVPTYHQTPHLERLAARGTVFTRAYAASPLCSPTRSAVLTGLSPARTGITAPVCHLPEVRLRPRLPARAAAGNKVVQVQSATRLDTRHGTLAESLKEAGYATGHFGKWHLGPEPFSPLEHGFDVDVPHWPGPGPAGSYVAPWRFRDFDPDPSVYDEHIEDRMAKEAVAWMEAHADGPFFLNYWMFSVHAPFDAKKALIEKHRARLDPAAAQRCPTYAAMVESMDDAVGTLLDALDRLGIAGDTLVVFTSDNGGNMYDDVDGVPPTSNVPLRGGKATMFEGGVRVPCVVAWPGVVKAGAYSDALVQSEDFFPTLLEALGLEPAAGQVFDGVSVLPAWRGEAMEHPPVFQFFPHSPGVPDRLPPSVSVHRGDWKLIRLFHQGDDGMHRHLLFDLASDLGETTDLAAERPDLVAQLDGVIEEFLAGTAAVVPRPNPDFDPSRQRTERTAAAKAAKGAGGRTSNHPIAH